MQWRNAKNNKGKEETSWRPSVKDKGNGLHILKTWESLKKWRKVAKKEGRGRPRKAMLDMVISKEVSFTLRKKVQDSLLWPAMQSTKKLEYFNLKIWCD